MLLACQNLVSRQRKGVSLDKPGLADQEGIVLYDPTSARDHIWFQVTGQDGPYAQC